MSCLVYTFRTLPFLAKVQASFQNVVVVGKLKHDIQLIEEILLKDPVEKVVGIAQSWDHKISFTEPLAINRFNRNKKIVRDGPEQFSLCIPDKAYNFKRNQKPGDSFCNWMMYRVAKVCADHELPTKHSFFHCKPSDLPKIIQLAAS